MSFIEARRPKARRPKANGIYIQAKLVKKNTVKIVWIENKGRKLGDKVEIKDTGEF